MAETSKAKVEKVEKIEDSKPSGTPTSSPKLKIVPIILIALVLLIAGVMVARFLNPDPKKVLSDAFKKSSEAKSASFKATSDDQKITVSGDMHEDEKKLSKLELQYKDTDQDFDIKVGMKVSKDDMYLDMNLLHADEILRELSAFSQLKTYQLLVPFIKGQKAVHISLPELSEIQKDTKESPKPSAMSKEEKDVKKMMDKLEEAMIIRRFERNATYGDQKYSKVVVGLNKTKLLEAIDQIKEMDVDVKISQINALKKIVNSSDEWDNDLFEIYIKDGYVMVMTFSLPEFSEEAIKEALSETAKDDPSLGSILENSKEQIGSLMKPKEKEARKLMKLGTIEFSNYNNAPEVAKPLDTVEFNDILENAKVEILPLILPFMGEAMGIPSMPPSLMPKSPVVPPRSFDRDFEPPDVKPPAY